MFDFYKDKGIAYLKAEGPPQIVRTVHAMDKVEADKVALRARAARKRADRLTGYAAGEELEAEEQEVLLLDEIRSLFGTASTMHLGDIASGLADRRPGTWGSLDAKGLGALLRGLTPPIEPTTVYVADKPAAERSGKGLKREQLEEATTSETSADGPSRNGRAPAQRVISNPCSVRSDRPVRRSVSGLTCGCLPRRGSRDGGVDLVV